MLTDAQRNRIDGILEEVATERARQERKCRENADRGWLTCADSRNDDGTRLAIVAEEFGEVGRTICEERVHGYAVGKIENRAGALSHRREELIQLAAVAIAWVEAIDDELADLQPEEPYEC